MAGSRKYRLGDMGDSAGQVGLSRRHDIMVVRVGDARRENDVADIHLLFQGCGQHGIGLDQRPVVAPQDSGRVVPVEQRPIGPVNADDLLRLDPVPQRQPPIRAVATVSAWGRIPGLR